MKNMILLSGGAIAGIVIGVAVVLIAIMAIIAVLLFLKMRGKGTPKFIEFTGDNSSLLKLVDVPNVPKDASVIVPPTHTALIIRNGAIVNECSEGEFPLTESGVTIHSLKILYISKTAKVTIKWGTQSQNRIFYLDPIVGKPVSVGSFGIMEIRVSDPKMFYKVVVASDVGNSTKNSTDNEEGDIYSTDKLQERMRALTINDTIRTIGQVLNEQKLTFVEFSTAQHEIQTMVERYLNSKFMHEYGFEVTNFIIENLNVDPDQKEEIMQIYNEDSAYERDKVLYARKMETEEREHQAELRRKEAVRNESELDDFIYNRELNRERDKYEYERKNRHEDEDRAWAREDKERDYEERAQNKYLDTVKDIEVSRSEAEKVRPKTEETPSFGNAGHHCSVCGSSYKPGAKYCPGCGAVLQREDISTKCPDCGGTVPWGTPYCPHCGHKFDK